ncbi:hypothetical protein M0811_00887 [Anaeramoeba ignava]|uniref:Uncharacterized protein n=1 Tax=Anaeramoeba ignava TaxID=1746090 RepID=A0A9Q0LMS1_ANAIG|nr:hypothetical protein M0811_00887 [Anaeramoeba ignava]
MENNNWKIEKQLNKIQTEDNEYSFYSLIWKFGMFLCEYEPKKKLNKKNTFLVSQVINDFIEDLPTKTPRIIKYIEMIGKLFKQCGVFVQATRRTKTNFRLNQYWKPVFASRKLACQSTNYSDSFPNQKIQSQQKKTRSDRTIAMLGFLIVDQFSKKETQKRESLANETGFSRQRVCSVLSVYKSIGLVSEDEGSKGFVKWNNPQSIILPDIEVYTNHLIQVRKKRRNLCIQAILNIQKMRLKYKKLWNLENKSKSFSYTGRKIKTLPNVFELNLLFENLFLKIFNNWIRSFVTSNPIFPDKPDYTQDISYKNESESGISVLSIIKSFSLNENIVIQNGNENENERKRKSKKKTKTKTKTKKKINEEKNIEKKSKRKKIIQIPKNNESPKNSKIEKSKKSIQNQNKSKNKNKNQNKSGISLIHTKNSKNIATNSFKPEKSNGKQFQNSTKMEIEEENNNNPNFKNILDTKKTNQNPNLANFFLDEEKTDQNSNLTNLFLDEEKTNQNPNFKNYILDEEKTDQNSNLTNFFLDEEKANQNLNFKNYILDEEKITRTKPINPTKNIPINKEILGLCEDPLDLDIGSVFHQNRSHKPTPFERQTNDQSRWINFPNNLPFTFSSSPNPHLRHIESPFSASPFSLLRSDPLSNAFSTEVSLNNLHTNMPSNLTSPYIFRNSMDFPITNLQNFKIGNETENPDEILHQDGFDDDSFFWNNQQEDPIDNHFSRNSKQKSKKKTQK